MKIITIVLCIFALALSCAAQTATVPQPQPAPQQGGLLDAIADPYHISLVSYSLAQIADSTTDWKFTFGGKQYSVNPTQRAAFAGATLFGAIAIAHYIPKAKPYVTAGLVIGTAILAGRAYGHTLIRTPGTPALR